MITDNSNNDNDIVTDVDGKSISDDDLFKEPLPVKEECQICTLVIPSDTGVFELLCNMYQLCCGKVICTGCSIALHYKNKDIRGTIKERCVFCNAPPPRSDNVRLERCKRRIQDYNDLNAYRLLGYAYQFGRWGLSRSANNALKLWNYAADQGDFKSHAAIGRAYLLGSPKQDMDKAIYHLKLAAIGGHVTSRHIIGMLEMQKGNITQAMKHFIISARSGYDNSLKQVKEGHGWSCQYDDVYSSTLVKHKESKDQMTSKERDEAAYHVRDMFTRACCSRNSQIDDNERDLLNFDLDISSIGRKAISDDELFKDPPPQEECPICFLPIPCHPSVFGVAKEYQLCCGKMACSACMDFYRVKCPFCTTPPVHLGNELLERCETRIDILDEKAFVELAFVYRDEKWGLTSDYKHSLDLLYQAAELALFSVDKPLFESSTAHFSIANAYLHGIGVEKNRSKAIYYWKLAAMGGHELARYNLGVSAELDDNLNRAMKHYMIAAKAGYNDALAKVGKGHKAGYVSKDDYVSTLRAFKVSRDNMSSNQRENVAASETGFNLPYVKTELNSYHQRLANFCAICKEALNKPSTEYQADPCEANEHGLSVTYGQCGHVYHLDCAQRWLKTHSVCPLCNYEWDFAKIEHAKYYKSESLQLNECVLFATDGGAYSISYQIDAAIVNTMKKCTTLPHHELVSQVQSCLARFTPQIKEIKERIEALIDREYIERSADDYQKYNVSASMLYFVQYLVHLFSS